MFPHKLRDFHLRDFSCLQSKCLQISVNTADVGLEEGNLNFC